MEATTVKSGTLQLAYFDHNATTPIAPIVREAMTAAMDLHGNPSSTHRVGREAREAVVRARAQVAAFLGASPDEVIFTGSGSEAINMAIKGVVGWGEDLPAHVVTSRIEHSATLETCRFLESHGVSVTYLPVDAAGRVDPDDVRKGLRPHTRLIAIMSANNETGTIQPIDAIGAIARTAEVPFFTDAVQAAGKMPLSFETAPVELLSISGHKLYGPKGVGVLLARRSVRLKPLVHGGGQEGGLRGGTENVLGIVGLGAACEHLSAKVIEEGSRIRALRDRLWDGIREVRDVRLNGSLPLALPGTLNVSFKDLRGEALALALSLEHIAVSTGSACHATRVEPSHVLSAMGVQDAWLHGSIRFSLGASNTEREIDRVVAAVAHSVTRLRGMLPVHAEGARRPASRVGAGASDSSA